MCICTGLFSSNCCILLFPLPEAFILISSKWSINDILKGTNDRCFMTTPQSQTFSLVRLRKPCSSHSSQGNSDLRKLQLIVFIGNCSVKVVVVLTFCDISNKDSVSIMKKNIPNCTLIMVKLQKNT